MIERRLFRSGYRTFLKLLPQFTELHSGSNGTDKLVSRLATSLFGVLLSESTVTRSGLLPTDQGPKEFVRAMFEQRIPSPCAAAAPYSSPAFPSAPPNSSSSTNSSSNQSEVEKLFWLVKRLKEILPDQAVDNNFMRGQAELLFAGAKKEATAATISKLLSQTNLVVQVPIDGLTFPLPRHLTPKEPIWVINQTEKIALPVVAELMAIEQAAAKNSSGSGELSSVASAATSVPLCRHVASPLSVQQFYSSLSCGQQPSSPPGVSLTAPTPSTLVVDVATEFVGMRDLPEEGKELQTQNVFQVKLTLSHKAEEAKQQTATAPIDGVSGNSNDASNQGSNGNVATPQAAEAPPSCHVLILSKHLLFVDIVRQTTEEVVGPGIRGEFVVLAPGERVSYELGVAMNSSPTNKCSDGFCGFGLVKGTLQCAAIPSSLVTAEILHRVDSNAVQYFDAVIPTTLLMKSEHWVCGLAGKKKALQGDQKGKKKRKGKKRGQKPCGKKSKR